MTDETWKETSAGLLTKAWECADEAAELARNSNSPAAPFMMQQAQFFALVAIYKLAVDVLQEWS